MDNQPALNKNPNLMLWIIWGALLMAILTYLVVLQISAPENRKPPEDQTIVKILGGVAAVCIAISFLIRGTFVQPMAKKAGADRMLALLPACIISWALAESVAIYGLVLGFMGYPLSRTGLFFLSSFAAMVFLAPTFASLKSFIKVLPDE